MGIFTSLIFFIIAIVSSCFYAILYGLSLEQLNNIIEKDYKAARKLKSLKNDINSFVDSFQILELVFLALSFFIYIENVEIFHVINWQILFYEGIAFFGIYFLIKIFLNAISLKFSDELALKLSGLIILFDFPARFITKFFNFIIDKVVGSSLEDASRDELTELVETAHEEGAIEHGEYRILKNMMHFKNVLVTDVMTPRTVIFSAEGDKSIDEVLSMPEFQMYSRFPIWEGESIDDGVIGYVMSKDILNAKLSGKGNTKLREYYREIFFIPENAELDDALERFLNRRQHIFMVVDEYGGVEGILTMEDVLETILGVEILDEVDKIADLRHLAKQRRDQRIANMG